MTMIAAFKVHDTPILVGDVAKSDGQVRNGSCKKVYKISNNLVVAWTGDMVAAQLVIKSLLNNLKRDRVNIADLTHTLTNFSVDDFGNFHTIIIGWLIDDGNHHSFRWNSGYPHELFWTDECFDGTGGEYFSSLIKHDNADESEFVDVKTDAGRAILNTINKISQARFQETLYPEEWDSTFGMSYEILYYYEGSFRYIDSITNIGWDYDWNPVTNTGAMRFPPHIFRYSIRADGPVIQKHGKPDQLGHSQVMEHQVRPLTGCMEPFHEVCTLEEISPLSSYYANYIRFWLGKECKLRTWLTIERPTPKGVMWIENRRDGYWFGMKESFLDDLYGRNVKD